MSLKAHTHTRTVMYRCDATLRRRAAVKAISVRACVRASAPFVVNSPSPSPPRDKVVGELRANF